MIRMKLVTAVITVLMCIILLRLTPIIMEREMHVQWILTEMVYLFILLYLVFIQHFSYRFRINFDF